MAYQRRQFLKISAALGSGLVLTSVSNQLIGCSPSRHMDVSKNFGLQLWTIREDMARDPRGTLTQVASFGYKQVEGFEGPKGIFWGMKNTEFKKLMDDLGMTFIASHCDINKDFDRKASEAAEIGMKYLICPYLGPQKSIDDFKRFAATFNERGATCKKNGIRFGYHNHDYGFIPLQGQLPQHILMDNTDKDLVDFEMDIYWVVTAGQDPMAWFNQYPDRFRLGHVKDRRKGAPATERDASVVLGTGSIDFNKLLADAQKKGLRYFIVEQELYEGTTPIEAARADAAYMKTLS